jgi:hypothetical protein
MKRIIFVVGVFSIYFGTLISFAQEDNGNLFEKTWGADESVFQGDWGELAVYAPEGLDIDQDGKREFIVYDHVTGTFTPFDRLQVWENVGDNDFFLAWEHIYTNVTSQFQQGHAISVADLDDDGMQEVLIVTESTLYIYEWDGTLFESGAGLPQEPTDSFFPFTDNLGYTPVRQLRVVNLDPDPEPEIFFGYSTNSGMYMSIASLPGKDFSNPDWKDEYADPFSLIDGWRVGGVAIDDFDGDGNMEIFTSNWQDAPTTRLYENTGIDTYEIKFTTLPDNLILQPMFDDNFANSIFHDFDGDGDSEFVITDIHGKMFVITKEASNNFEDFGPSAWTYVLTIPGVMDNGFVRSGFLHDLDQDGKSDIYYNDKGAVGGGGVYDLEYQDGPVTDPNSWKVYKIYDNNGHLSVAGEVYPAGDLDGDGRGELVIVAWSNQPQDLVIIESLHAPSAVKKIEETKQTVNYVLHQNYPNPFNPDTQISFQLKESGQVKLEVYSVTGRKVRTLINEFKSVGVHSIKFHANNLSSNLYFSRLSINDFVQQKKMLLLK